MTNEELFNYCLNKNGSPISIRMRWHVIKCHPEIYEYLINYFDDADDTNSSASEILYRIMHNITVRPKCMVCGKPAKFLRADRGYGEFCSVECRKSEAGQKIVTQHTEETFMKKYGMHAFKNPKVKQKIRETNIEKYGGPSPACDKDVIAKQIATKREIYGEHLEKINEKIKQTNLERYGCEFTAQNPECLQKMINTQVERYGGLFNPEKRKGTCLERYGVEIYAASEDIKGKRTETMIQRYGVDSPMKNKDIVKKQRNTMLERYGYDHNFKNPKHIEKMKSPEMRERQWETKKKRRNANTSKIEEQFAEYLINNNYVFERNYGKDARYPYHVDFYLPDYDLFIEIQGTWLHGGHAFNSENEKDIELLNYWIRKSNEINYKGEKKTLYNNAIKVWTKRDVEKRKCAKDNNLNYLEIFACDMNTCIQLFEQKINNKNKK